MILLLFAITIATGFYFLHLNYKYWIRRGVPGPKPIYIIGNLLDNILLKKTLGEVYADIYRQYKNASFVGIFKGGTPVLIARDPDFIKDMQIKSFQHFHNNEIVFDKDLDPISGRNLFFLRGDDWKATRTLLTPAFSSAKMKTIYPLLEETGKQFVTYIENHPTACRGKGADAKELCMRFTLNNVGSCAFGLEAKCFEEENPEFKQIADNFFNPDAIQSFKIMAMSIFPVLMKFLSIKFTPAQVEEKLTNIVTQTIKYRDENQIVRNDFLNVLIQIHKTNKNFTETDVTAQAAGFFADGYESSSIVMHFMLYEIAANQEVQKKLREEVQKAFKENHNSLPYEKIDELSYLDAAFFESLRLHAPGSVFNKLCTKPYTYIPKEDDEIKKPFVIEANTTVIIPLFGLQRDPKYFEDPDSFKPERFFNMSNTSRNAFFPFGRGPRSCLGQRFGTLQIKVGVAYILNNFEISVNSKTQLPIKYDPKYFMTLPVGGFWLDFKKL